MPSLEGSRDTVWPELCRAMHVWLKENEAPRALIVDTDRPSWGSPEAFYGYWMVALCLRLRWAREKWIRSLFRCLCMQFQVDTAEELATKLSFVCAWIVTILLYMLASALAGSDLTMAWLKLVHHMNDGWSIGGRSDSTRQGWQRTEKRSMPIWQRMEGSASGYAYPIYRVEDR